MILISEHVDQAFCIICALRELHVYINSGTHNVVVPSYIVDNLQGMSQIIIVIIMIMIIMIMIIMIMIIKIMMIIIIVVVVIIMIIIIIDYYCYCYYYYYCYYYCYCYHIFQNRKTIYVDIQATPLK